MRRPVFAIAACVFAALLTNLAGSVARAEIIPSWSTPNNTTANVPIGSSSVFRAEGLVSGVFDALLVFDVSPSMNESIPANVPAARNGGRRKRDWALDGADDLIDALPDQIRLGLVKFDSGATMVIPPSPMGPPAEVPSHRQTLKTTLRSLQTGSGTNIANAIGIATQQLTAFPGAGESLHLVLVTDGASTGGNPFVATTNAIAKGIDSVNAIALPGADTSALRDIADLGRGVFVDGTDLTHLLTGFKTILDGAETLAQLDIELPDGNVIENVTTTAGRFAIDGRIVAGNNRFRARATSNLGNLVTKDLNVIGVTVPEPISAVTSIIGGMFVSTVGRAPRNCFAALRSR